MFYRRIIFGRPPLHVAGTATAAAAAGTLLWSPHSFVHAVSHAEPASIRWQTGQKGPKNLGNQLNVVLYQYDVCPFCNKVKAFLDYQGIPYTAVEVNPLTKREMKWSKDYRMVPFAVVNGVKICGSSDIIDYLCKQIKSQEKEDEKVEAWYQWVDEKLVRKLAPNIYRTWPEATESFEYISENSALGNGMSAFVTQYVGAIGMYFIAKRLCKKYGIDKGQERKALYDDVNTWLEAVRNKDSNAKQPYSFLNGAKEPTKADLAVFGVLRSLEGYRYAISIFFFLLLLSLYQHRFILSLSLSMCVQDLD